MNNLDTVYILIAVAFNVIIGVVLMSGCDCRGRGLAVTSFVLAVVGMIILLI